MVEPAPPPVPDVKGFGVCGDCAAYAVVIQYGNNRGECRRTAPTSIPRMPAQDRPHVTWPLLRELDWCGQWVKRRR